MTSYHKVQHTSKTITVTYAHVQTGYIKYGIHIHSQIQLSLCKLATLKKTKIGFQDQFSLNAGQKYCRMLQGEHSAILLTFIYLPFVIKTVVYLFLSGRSTQIFLRLIELHCLTFTETFYYLTHELHIIYLLTICHV